LKFYNTYLYNFLPIRPVGLLAGHMHYLALDILLDLLVCIATLLQAVIKQRIVRLKDDYEVEESLREEFAGVVVNNDTPLFHQLLKIVIDLQNAYVSPDRIN
jgi:hypothetical protein